MSLHRLFGVKKDVVLYHVNCAVIVIGIKINAWWSTDQSHEHHYHCTYIV